MAKMVDFDRNTNNDNVIAKAPVDTVKFGRSAPVLEVELNEAQELAGNRLSQLASIIGDCIIGNNSVDIIQGDGCLECTVSNNTYLFISGRLINISGKKFTINQDVVSAGAMLEICMQDVLYTNGMDMNEFGLIDSPDSSTAVDVQQLDYTIKDKTVQTLTTQRKGYILWIGKQHTSYDTIKYNIPQFGVAKPSHRSSISLSAKVGTQSFNGHTIDTNMSDTFARLCRVADDHDYYIEKTGVLAANTTSLTIDMGVTIDENDIIDIYSSTYGVSPKTVTTYGTNVIMTFKSQATATTIKVIRKKRG